ncbi:MAG: heme-binding domain-containing protein [Bacteroidia bacterium]|jgi:cbb3-type cytochrome oxidase cytochrome c subunit|nr:heme-binding domain-containing protein [Bacteroidia bacterium]
MKTKLSLKRIGIAFIVVFIVIQVFRINKTITPVNEQTDFMAVTQTNPEVATILKNACYDCHSNQPTYPWYTSVAPVSWWIKNHINEGSKHLNFSIWQTYTVKRKDHKLEECVEMIEEGEMPMNSYTWMHPEAKLTDAQKQLLIDWFKAEKAKLNYVAEK